MKRDTQLIRPKRRKGAHGRLLGHTSAAWTECGAVWSGRSVVEYGVDGVWWSMEWTECGGVWSGRSVVEYGVDGVWWSMEWTECGVQRQVRTAGEWKNRRTSLNSQQVRPLAAHSSCSAESRRRWAQAHQIWTGEERKPC
ncbi:hypothetical protein NHX12_033576 [Muraenolepis orangiensis]|uniref:Uncharacterized protein n=1 Tax=Muraenolepis orangiensis TaxID=630683 RepID=A0A9Q0IIW8_9TELE|nr:hypothetical protein NHX12_033576 [Muraenolepis orangiensis]